MVVMLLRAFKKNLNPKPALNPTLGYTKQNESNRNPEPSVMRGLDVGVSENSGP